VKPVTRSANGLPFTPHRLEKGGISRVRIPKAQALRRSGDGAGFDLVGHFAGGCAVERSSPQSGTIHFIYTCASPRLASPAVLRSAILSGASRCLLEEAAVVGANPEKSGGAASCGFRRWRGEAGVSSGADASFL